MGVVGVLEIKGSNKLIIEKVLSILKDFRYLFKDVFQSKNILKKDMLKLKIFQDVVYPCDVIDLREILTTEKLKRDACIPLFSVRFAEKYLKRYPIFLVIKLSDLQKNNVESRSFGGVIIYKSKELDIEDIIKRIIINKPVDKNVIETVANIIIDTDYKVEQIISNSVPGISSPSSKLSFYLIKNIKENTMTNNWYKKTKISQSLLDSDYNEPERDKIDNSEEGIVKGPKEYKAPYEVGMKVRDRRKGVALPQEYGRVDSIQNNKMKITWYDKKNKKIREEIFDVVENTSELSFIVAEV